MIRLLLFCIALILHLMHCIILLLAHIRLFYTLDHAELKPEAQAEQAQAEEFTNLVCIKASPGTSHSILDFYFLINIFILRMIVH
jgi:hypothetical protein